MGGLDLAIDPLLLDGQTVEIELRGRSQGLDDVLHRVPVHAVPQIEQQHRDFGVGQESREDIALSEVLADRVVVGKVAVVDQRLVEPDKRMRPARMPNAALGGIPLMGDPDVGP